MVETVAVETVLAGLEAEERKEVEKVVVDREDPMVAEMVAEAMEEE